MEINNAAEALIALASSDNKRSQTAKLRGIIDAVELALNAGVAREVVLQSLNESGLEMNMKSFESALYRLRKERKKNDGLHNPIQQSTSSIGLHKPNAGESKLDASTAHQSSTLQNSEQSQLPSDDESVAGLSIREKREKKANQYVSDKLTNPLLKNLKR